MLLVGEYEHTIDAKGRLAIPADIRGQWRPERDGSAWYLVPWLPDRCVRLYTESEYKRRATFGDGSLLEDPDEVRVMRAIASMTSRSEADSAGRVRVPDRAMQLTGLGREVMLVGVQEWLEIHDRESWRAAEEERAASLPDLMRELATRRRNGAG
ncbi:MAG: hypothetical protein AAGD00_02935 [Planctomycetota bacterium]